MTIKEIAKKANVSITTVSFYLNGKTKGLSQATIDRIKKIVEENNYQPNITARNLRLKTTNNIGIIVNDMTQGFASKLYKSISKGLENENYIISLIESRLDPVKEEEIITSLLQMKAKAIVIQSSSTMLKKIEKIKSRFPKSETHIIVVDSHHELKNVSCVYNNPTKIVQETIEKARKNKIERILFVTDDPKLLQARTLRVNLIKEFSDKNGIAFKMLKTKNNEIPDDTFEKEIVQNQKIENTLIWANNSEIAFSIYAHIVSNKFDKIKNNIYMMSFNKCFFKPIVKIGISSIDTKTHEIGTQIAELIIQNTVSNKEIVAEEHEYK